MSEGVRSREEIQRKIDQIENDDRWSYDSADVQTNAPLALQQTAMEARHQALKWVLGETGVFGGGLQPLEEGEDA